MSLAPTGGAPVGAMSLPAGAGAFTINGAAVLAAYNAANYSAGAFAIAGGSGASFAGLGFQPNQIFMYLFENVAGSDQVTLPNARGIYAGTINDGLLASLTTTTKVASHLSSGMTFAGSAGFVWKPGASIVESLVVRPLAQAGLYAQVGLTDRLAVAHKVTVGLLASLHETVQLSPLFEAYFGTLIYNRVVMADRAQARVNYQVVLQHTIRLASVFQRFVGGFMDEGVIVDSEESVSFHAVAQLVEALTLAINESHYMAFRLTVADDANIDAGMALSMIFQGRMSEFIDLEILYQSLDGNLTGFAINTRTGAVTEYQNWAFNSFVQIGNKYLAASKSGLYELQGSTDDGVSVIADIMGGFFQPADGKLAGLKGVYLGQTGQGYWLLKLDMGDGREYVYQRLSNPGMMTTKFDVGKGLNARYIGWELINVEGQDFDLDTIEFVPMLRSRRI